MALPLARLSPVPRTGTDGGYPWHDGELLYAGDLNAGFLPLTTGGTVTGPVNLVPGLPGDNQLHISGADSSAAGPFGSALVIQRTYDFTGPSGVGGGEAGSFLGVLSPVIVQTTLTHAPEMFVWNMRSEMYIRTVGTSNGQHVGISSNVFRQSGVTPAFIYHGQYLDSTGTGVAGIVGCELDIRTNGPEGSASGINPQFGGRTYLELNSTTNQPPTWLPSNAYALGYVVQANGFTYVCTVAGTSASTQPTWPTAPGGTVTDGSVTWQYGTTIAVQVSRAINIGGETIGGQPSVSYGAGIVTSAAFYDAILEFTFATLVDGGVNDAAIRLASNMPIDFSGDVGQNRHVLQFTNGIGLQYISFGSGFSSATPLLTIQDASGGNVILNGPLNVGGQGIAYAVALGSAFTNRTAFGWSGTDLLFRINGLTEGSGIIQRSGAQISFDVLPINAPNDAAAAGAGVAVGGVYRNASVLMVRTI